MVAAAQGVRAVQGVLNPRGALTGLVSWALAAVPRRFHNVQQTEVLSPPPSSVQAGVLCLVDQLVLILPSPRGARRSVAASASGVSVVSPAAAIIESG